MARPSRAEEVQTERRRRKPNNGLAGLKLAVPPELLDLNKFVYRWANENDRRLIDLTENDDYEIVKDTRIEGEGEGTPVTKVVGTQQDGKALRAYLLRKPKHYYDEDRRANLKAISETEDQIRRGLPNTATDPGLAGVSYTPGPVPGQNGVNIIDGR
jgi:hypothetical protein